MRSGTIVGFVFFTGNVIIRAMNRIDTRFGRSLIGLSALVLGLALVLSCKANKVDTRDEPDDASRADVVSGDIEYPWEPVAIEESEGGEEPEDAPSARPEPAAAPTGQGARLNPGLTVRVKVLVLGKAEIDEDNRRVSDEGNLVLPLIGDVHVAGMSLQELNRELTTRYSEYFLRPQVVADYVMEAGEAAISPWGYVTVLGKVKKPGRVNIPPTRDLSVSSAIQRAGGLDTSAKDSEIRVTRLDKQGEPEIMTVNLRALGSKRGRKKNDIILQPGDVIRVPEKFF